MAGHKPTPNYGIIDSQSAKTTLASDDRGFDGGKKVKGRKRHIVTDTMGNLLAICVHAANSHDTKSGINPARKAFAKYPSIRKFCGDQGYRKTFIADVKTELGLEVDISPKILPEFGVSPKRWIVERTFAWANHSRRLSKDYEISTVHEENIFIISNLHSLLRRY
jgi:putative transposase